MKKLLTLATLLALTLVITACSNNPAPLLSPEPEVSITLDVVSTPPDDIILEEHENGYEDDFIFDNDGLWNDMPTFGSITGTVVGIEAQYTYPPTYFFLIEGESGSANLMTHFNTFILGATPELGDTITGFYVMEPFMAAIYPPQFNTSVILNQDVISITVDRFDDDLISYDGFLRLNIGEETEIILQDGEPFDCELAHRKLVVLYDISTRSIPAQTTPTKIIVLFEQFTTGPAFL